MTRKDKFHLISFFLLLLGVVLLDQSPKLLNANVNANSQFRLTKQTGSGTDSETHNLDDSGVSLSSSGYRANRTMYAFHETFINVKAPSATLILDPMVVLSTRSQDIGGLSGGTTVYYTSASFNARIRPIGNYARQIQILASGATGYVIITGTDAWGRRTDELVYFTSSAFLFFSKVPYQSISSFTFVISSFNTQTPTATFLVGTSTGVGIQNTVDTSSAVTSAYRNGILITTGTLITAEQNGYMINLASNAMDNSNNTDVTITTRAFVWHDVSYDTRRTRHGQ